MSIGGRIRFLLLLLGICCIITAISINNSVTVKDLLQHEASDLQKNLSAKEKIVESYLTNPDKLNDLKNFYKNEKLSLSYIDTLKYREQGINILVYKNGQLDFWSSIKAFPPKISSLPEGSSFIPLPNGWYEIIKKTDKNWTFVFLITVKTQFSIENQYLKNQIVPELFNRNSLELASFTDKEIVDIFNIKKEYIFSVKLSDEFSKNIYTTIQLWLWLVGLFSICLFVNSYGNLLVKKGNALAGTMLVAIFFVVLRYTDLKYFWFNHKFNLPIFSPSIYAENEFLPSLGDLLLNVIAFTWVALFAYRYRKNYVMPRQLTQRKSVGVLLHILMLTILAVIAFLIDYIFEGLINNSKINFDITNIINLHWNSWVVIFVLCLVWFNVYLLSNIFIELSKQLKINNKERLIIFLAMLGGYFIYMLIDDFTIFFLVYALLILVISWNNYIQFRRFSISVFAILFLCMAFLSAIKYIRFNDLKERNNRVSIAEKLLNTVDPTFIQSINSFEDSFSSDSSIISHFKDPKHIPTYSFQSYIAKKYLDGYLSRFDDVITAYTNADSALKHDEFFPFSKYKDLVKTGSVKVQGSNYFYRINDTFGSQNYFGIIPIFDGGNLLGKLVIELISQPYDFNNHFPELLIDGKLKSDEDFSQYSIAFYKNNRLFNQSGKYTYAMENTDFKFKGGLKSMEFVNDKNADTFYSHGIYSPDSSKLIIISKEKVPYVARLATLSFFFLVFIIFGMITYVIFWFAQNLEDNNASWFDINRYLMINANKILYKTRIQVSIVLSVVATLLIVGWTTFFYIKSEYLEQQEDSIREKIRKVQLAYEKQILNVGVIRNDDAGKFDFTQFADVNAAFLNLYDTKGNLMLTSLEKMYNLGIIGKKMGPKAFVALNLMQRSEFLNTSEKIGTFTYAAAYAPIRNSQNQTIAYIGLPYYANEADYQAKIGLFINTLINIYALVFVLIGVLAVFLANQITNPLTFIQESIKKTKLGQKNQPIVWHRQDEIGSLVKEYNKMIAALEISATKLARSERESAWREMAKQVAHEIKNPLTPLKLGVQLLEKSWKEKDVNFEKKFASFNKSFIEQIDSLATIASEFSNFAKMPDTKLEELELLSVIEQAIGVFNTAENVEIIVLNRTNRQVTVLGDRDQLLRTFNNLLKNAIEASEGKERCAIRVRMINDEKNAYVEVEDNGKGIDISLQEKIFVPNFTTKSSGTGLGLAFVKQAIENAGGNIEFTSEINQGTTFFLTFPLV